MGLINKEHSIDTTTTKHRSNFVLLVFIVAFIILVCSLIDLQFIKKNQILEATSIKHTRTLKIQGTRGKILDVNGIPLAQDEVCYNLEFYREYNLKSERESYTNSIIFAIELINKYGRDIEPTFAITKNAEGNFVFTVAVQIPKKLSKEQRDILVELAKTMNEQPPVKKRGIFG